MQHIINMYQRLAHSASASAAFTEICNDPTKLDEYWQFAIKFMFVLAPETLLTADQLRTMIQRVGAHATVRGWTLMEFMVQRLCREVHKNAQIQNDAIKDLLRRFDYFHNERFAYTKGTVLFYMYSQILVTSPQLPTYFPTTCETLHNQLFPQNLHILLEMKHTTLTFFTFTPTDILVIISSFLTHCEIPHHVVQYLYALAQNNFYYQSTTKNQVVSWSDVSSSDRKNYLITLKACRTQYHGINKTAVDVALTSTPNHFFISDKTGHTLMESLSCDFFEFRKAYTTYIAKGFPVCWWGIALQLITDKMIAIEQSRQTLQNRLDLLHVMLELGVPIGDSYNMLVQCAAAHNSDGSPCLHPAFQQMIVLLQPIVPLAPSSSSSSAHHVPVPPPPLPLHPSLLASSDDSVSVWVKRSYDEDQSSNKRNQKFDDE